MKYLKNKVKEKLRKCQMVLGAWVQLPSLETTEILAKNNPDFIVVDLEHSCIGFETLQKMLMVIEGYDIPHFVRVNKNDPDIIKRVLEAGVYGVIVPMINSGEEAQKAVDSIAYVPKGIRGVGLSRAQSYSDGLEKYKEWYQNNIVLIAQIETASAIENLESILSCKEVDATLIGPYDLSASLGYPGDFQRPEMVEALQRYESISKRQGRPHGYHIVHPTAELIQEKLEKNYKFIICGSDQIFLMEKSKSEFERIKKSASQFLTAHGQEC